MSKEQPAGSTTTASPGDQILSVSLIDPYRSPDQPHQQAGVRLPQVCTCCLRPTTSQALVRWSQTTKSWSGVNRVHTTRSASLAFYVCDECQAHEKEYLQKRSRLVRLVIALSSMLSAALLFVFSSELDALPTALAFLAGFILLPAMLAFGFIFILDLGIRLPALGRRHASRTKGVIMTGPGSFDFDNLDYGQAFAAANRGGHYQVSAKPHRARFTNKVHGRSMLEGKPMLSILGVGLSLSVAATLALLLLAAMLFAEPFASSQCGPWCGGIGIGLLFLAIFFAGKGEPPE